MLTIRTCSDALLSAFDCEGNRIASLFADHVPREIAEYRRVLQGLKAETSLAGVSAPSRWQQFERRREEVCGRQRRRVRGVCSNAATFVAGLAARRGASRIHCDDRDHSYIESFPWLQLQCVIKEKLDALGVAVTAATEGSGTSEVRGHANRRAAVRYPAADSKETLDRRSAG